MQVIKQDQVQEKIITLRDQKIIVDTDVAELEVFAKSSQGFY